MVAARLQPRLQSANLGAASNGLKHSILVVVDDGSDGVEDLILQQLAIWQL